MSKNLLFKQGTVTLHEVLSYSHVKQQWLVAFDSNGTVEGLLIKSWHDSKREALLELKKSLEFRLGFYKGNCTFLYEKLDAISKELLKVK